MKRLLIMGLLAGLSGQVRAQSGPVADYLFDGNLNSAVVGAPALTALASGQSFATESVRGQSEQVLLFPAGAGLLLDATGLLTNNDQYTILLTVRLDNFIGFRKLIDFNGGTQDPGLYVQGSTLRLYPYLGSQAAPITTLYYQIALVRESNGTARAYVDGAEMFRVDDTSFAVAVLNNSNIFRLLADDTQSAGFEQSSGAIARLTLYNRALTGELPMVTIFSDAFE